MSKQLKPFFLVFTILGGIAFAVFLAVGIFVTPFALIGCALGAIFLAVGIIPLAVISRKAKAREALIADGYRIDAVIRNIEVNNAVTVNMQNPYRIVCEGRDQTGAERVFVSENILQRLPSTLEGEAVTVYVSRQDPQQYYVDVRRFVG